MLSSHAPALNLELLGKARDVRPSASRRASPALPSAFGPALLAWFAHHRRPLPWRRDRAPYPVWLAEVLLQQTRVEQARPYFERFLGAFPTVEALAAAPRDRVLKLWQGAGYYARAHRLHETAGVVARELGGRWPRTVPELERLPGIGRYTARAVAAIAFDAPVVPVEANGLRVAARVLREEGDVRRPAVARRLERSLEQALGGRPGGRFGEALMELGETVCRPRRPRCPVCPLAPHCRAHRELRDPSTLPRVRRARRPHVEAAVVVLVDRRGRWLLQRRPPGGLLGGLWEFPGGKLRPGESPAHAAARELFEETGARTRRLEPLGVVRHGYSHFTVALHVFRGRPLPPGPRTGPTRRWVDRARWPRLPVPKATEKVARRLEEAEAGRASRGSGSRRGRSDA